MFITGPDPKTVPVFTGSLEPLYLFVSAAFPDAKPLHTFAGNALDPSFPKRARAKRLWQATAGQPVRKKNPIAQRHCDFSPRLKKRVLAEA
jgi:hypothetical protein